MRWRTVSATLLIAAGAATLAPQALGGLRCDTDLVARGMTFLEVVERCGEPQYELGWNDYRYPGLFVRVDEWTYELGTNKFRRQLTFENGRLIRIETRRKPTGTLGATSSLAEQAPYAAPW